MKKLGIHQPNFLAWGGFWDKMQQSDEFVILDDVQYTHSSYINRVRMGNGDWFTFPIVKNKGQLINQVKLVDSKKNCKKLYKTICQNYGNVSKEFYWLNNIEIGSLLTLNLMLIQTVRYIKGINTPILLSSDLRIKEKGSDRILEICKKLNYNKYLTGIGGQKYIDIEKFKNNQIEVEFCVYQNSNEDITILKSIKNETKQKSDCLNFSTTH